MVLQALCKAGLRPHCRPTVGVRLLFTPSLTSAPACLGVSTLGAQTLAGSELGLIGDAVAGLSLHCVKRKENHFEGGTSGQGSSGEFGINPLSPSYAQLVLPAEASAGGRQTCF